MGPQPNILSPPSAGYVHRKFHERHTTHTRTPNLANLAEMTFDAGKLASWRAGSLCKRNVYTNAQEGREGGLSLCTQAEHSVHKSRRRRTSTTFVYTFPCQPKRNVYTSGVNVYACTQHARMPARQLARLPGGPDFQKLVPYSLWKSSHWHSGALAFWRTGTTRRPTINCSTTDRPLTDRTLTTDRPADRPVTDHSDRPR